MNLVFHNTIPAEARSYCPVCNAANIHWQPLPNQYLNMWRHYGFKRIGSSEMTPLYTYSCPACGASDRERLYALFLCNMKTKRRASPKRMIHFAPEPALSKHIRQKQYFASYQTADMSMPGVDFHADLQSLPFESGTFDFFICSHVLEHVPDDRKAIRELHRITRPGGSGLLMAPVDSAIETTLEDLSITDAGERWRLFGQDDHLRLYSHDDYADRIKENGFSLQQMTRDDFGENVFHQLGLKPSSILYVVSKPSARAVAALPRKATTAVRASIPSTTSDPSMRREMTMPKVSVILTSRNHEKFLDEAIQSVLAQTYRNFELIIWDDASTDDSWSIIQQYSDRRIRAFKNDVQRYGAYGINKVISEIAQGEYIAIHHSDDVWELEKLEKQANFLDQHPETGAVFSWINIIDDNGNINNGVYLHEVFKQNNKTRYEWLRLFFLEGNSLCHPTVLIRKQCYADCGLYSLALWQLPDFDMWIRLCFRHEIHVLPEYLVKFRWKPDGTNTSAVNKQTLNRTGFEYYMVLNNYCRIASIEEFLKIFPFSEKYCIHPDSDLEFALAMTVIETNSTSKYRLFGLQLLHKLMTSPERARKILEVHHFSYMDFMNISKQMQIFALQDPSTSFQTPESPFPLTRGIQAFNDEDNETAIECLSAAMTQEPDNPLPSAYLAFICARQGLLQEAYDFIVQSTKIAPNRVDLIAALGETFLKNKRPSEAVKYLREAVHIQPDLFAAYPALAQSLHLTGQSEEAITLLQTVATLPSSAQTNIQGALLQILAECGDLSEFTKFTLRFSTGLADDLLAARCLARFDESGEQFLEALSCIQARTIENVKGYSCPLILSRFDFGADGIYHCCVDIGAAERPLVVPFNGGEFPFDEYLESASKYIQNNLRLEGACKGCQYLQYRQYSTQFNGFNYISINNWASCHLKCYYCDLDKASWRKSKITPYNPLPALKSLYDKNWIQKSALLDFGGGEPSIYEYLDDLIDFALSHDMNCHINTNAVIFSQAIFDALRHQGRFSVTISPDAGTAESYHRVKGQNLFYAVSENIIRYAQTGGDIALKFNISPYANSKDDIRGFVNILEKSRITRVKISPEINAYNTSNQEYRKLLHFARDLYAEISGANVNIELPFWKYQDIDFIRSKSFNLPELKPNNDISLIKNDKNTAVCQTAKLTKIAFMIGDFTSYHQLEQLYALLRHLPAERFFTLSIFNYTHSPRDDVVQMCALLTDSPLNIHEDKDDNVVEKLRTLAPDILINMDVYTPSSRLATFLGAPAPHKFLWAEAPMPPIAPDVRTLAGELLSVEHTLPTLKLPGMGEVFDLPELPFTDDAARKAGEPPVLGCLVPAAGIGRNGWQLFAETLRQHSSATLVINLDELGLAAQTFISGQFSSAGVDPARLVFISVYTTEEFCLAWQSIDLGLLPPVNPGGLALPTCLWMGRPCLIPGSILPWSQRPAALLKALGREEWMAIGEPHFVDLARQLAPSRVKPDPALRERMKALGLTDAKGFARGFADVMAELSWNPTPPGTPGEQ